MTVARCFSCSPARLAQAICIWPCPLAIAVAIAIAAMKGSMVASVFMHLSHERKWIYGALLLTALFFIACAFVPLITVSDGIGTPTLVAISVPVGGH